MIRIVDAEMEEDVSKDGILTIGATEIFLSPGEYYFDYQKGELGHAERTVVIMGVGEEISGAHRGVFKRKYLMGNERAKAILKEEGVNGYDVYNAARSEAASKFLHEIAEVCRRHRLSISHEDTHGAFQVIDFDEECIEWLMDATEDSRR